MKIKANFDMTREEENWYVENILKELNISSEDEVETVSLTIGEDGKVDADVQLKKQEKFERIRRITGYLVGTVDRWNDAKKKELEDRVKHAG